MKKIIALEKVRKSVGGKVIPLRESIQRYVGDGDTIALGGWIITRCVVAGVHELIRQRKMNLTVCQSLAGFDTDLLVGAGNVKRLVTAGGSLDAFGRLNRINDLCVAGKVQVEENSALGMATRFLAGSLGLPFMPVRSLLGSTILDNLKGEAKVAAEMDSPFDGERVVLLRSLNVKTSIIHVQRADEEGNAQVSGPLWDTQAMAGASERILITTEEIVERSEIRRTPEKTLIPGFKVASVSLVPFGSYPTSCYEFYDYDREHLETYAKASARAEQFDGYLQDNVLDRESFEDYLESRCPPARRQSLKAKQGRGY
jgi:glutaconate CoA-transferase, subunit A